MIIFTNDNPYDTSLTDGESHFEDDAGGGPDLADSIEDDRSRHEQVISELTEFENAQCRTEEEEAILEKNNNPARRVILATGRDAGRRGRCSNNY